MKTQNLLFVLLRLNKRVKYMRSETNAFDYSRLGKALFNEFSPQGTDYLLLLYRVRALNSRKTIKHSLHTF